MKAFSEQQIVDRLLESGPSADEREVRQALLERVLLMA